MVFFARVILIAMAAAAAGLACGPVHAGDKLMTGGVIVDAVSGIPLPGVTVAVFDDKGAVVGTDTTDDEGRWALETTWGICHLKEPPGGRGLFSSIVGVVSWPVKTTARIVGRPVKAAIKSAARAAGGAAVAGASVAAASGAGAVAVAAAGAAGKAVGSYSVEQVVGDPDDEMALDQKNRSSASQVRVRVWQTGYKDYTGAAGINLLDRTVDEQGSEISLAVADTVRLAPSDSTVTSRAPRDIGTFRNVRGEPGITTAGSKVRLELDIELPEIDDGWIWVVGRNLTTGQDIIMRNSGGIHWDGVSEIPAKGPFRDHQFTFVAYRTKDGKGERDLKIESQIERQGCFDPKKPFPADPAILASRNRGYAVVTVARGQ